MPTGDRCPARCPGTGWARRTSAGSSGSRSPNQCTPGLSYTGIFRACEAAPCPPPTRLNQALAPNFVSSAYRKIGFESFCISKTRKQTNWNISALEKYLFDVVWCLNCPWNFFQLHLKKKKKVDALPKPCFSLNRPLRRAVGYRRCFLGQRERNEMGGRMRTENLSF